MQQIMETEKQLDSSHSPCHDDADDNNATRLRPTVALSRMETNKRWPVISEILDVMNSIRPFGGIPVGQIVNYPDMVAVENIYDRLGPTLVISLPDTFESVLIDISAQHPTFYLMLTLDLKKKIPMFEWVVHLNGQKYLIVVDQWHLYGWITSCFNINNSQDTWLPIMFATSNSVALTWIRLDNDLMDTMHIYSFDACNYRPYRMFDVNELDEAEKKAKNAVSCNPWKDGYWTTARGYVMVEVAMMHTPAYRHLVEPISESTIISEEEDLDYCDEDIWF